MKKPLLILLCLPIVVCASFPVLEDKTNLNNDSCDNIILKNKEEISAKVIEITPDLIKYKKCRNLEDSSFFLSKNEVLMLRYNDGSKDIFSSTEKKHINNDIRKNSTISIISLSFAIIGMWSLIFGFYPSIIFFFGYFGIILGRSSFNDKLWGFGLAGLILAIIEIIIQIVVI